MVVVFVVVVIVFVFVLLDQRIQNQITNLTVIEIEIDATLQRRAGPHRSSGQPRSDLSSQNKHGDKERAEKETNKKKQSEREKERLCVQRRNMETLKEEGKASYLKRRALKKRGLPLLRTRKAERGLRTGWTNRRALRTARRERVELRE